MTQDMLALAFALRCAVTVTALATTFAAHRALFRDAEPTLRRRAGAVLGSIAGVCAVLSHVRSDALDDALPRMLPLGLAVGLGLVLVSVVRPSLRGAFDRLRDGDIRLLVGTRAAYGAMLLAFAALGILPASFALSAGIGDLVAATLAIGAPGSLDRSGSRLVRGVVHGFGLLDMISVVAQAMLVVRPLAIAHPGTMTSMTLPWLVVPLMVALDLHGLRKAFAASALGDGSEPARGIRSALS